MCRQRMLRLPLQLTGEMMVLWLKWKIRAMIAGKRLFLSSKYFVCIFCDFFSSCWAFSTTGALEGQHFRKTKRLVSLSEQNLIDCSSAYGNEGCDGGWIDSAFQYIKDNGGIDSENSYPYKAKERACKYKKKTSAADLRGFVNIPEGDEEQLMAAIATIGPISVAIDSSHESFQFYSGGVYYEPKCHRSADQLDHAMLAVGFSTDKKRKEYFIVKNSWGE